MWWGWYFSEVVDGVGNDLGCVDEERDCSGDFADGGSAVGVVVAEVDIVGEEAETAPEEEAVDPPPHSVAVLLCLITQVLSSGTSSSANSSYASGLARLPEGWLLVLKAAVWRCWVRRMVLQSRRIIIYQLWQ